MRLVRALFRGKLIGIPKWIFWLVAIIFLIIGKAKKDPAFGAKMTDLFAKIPFVGGFLGQMINGKPTTGTGDPTGTA